MVRNLYFLALASLFSLTSFAASFTSTTTGNWNNPATWTVVGLDSDGIPDADDDVTISGVTVTLNLASNFCRDLTISSGTFNLNNRVLRIYGDLTRTGGTILGSAAFHFYASPGTITGLFTSGGNWYFPANSDITIDPSTVIQKSGTFNLYSGTIVTNQGLVRLTGGGISYNTASGTWINAAGSTLQVSANFTGTGTLDCSANPNTMIFNGAAITGIRRTTYHHLTIQNCTSAPILVNATYTINGNLRIVGSGSTLDCNNISIDLAGNWTNTANTSCLNMATVTFLGGGTQTITRPSTERFNDLTVSTTGTVQLATGILLTGDLLLSTGTFDVTATNYSVNVRGDFTNDGVNFMANQGTFTLSGTAVQTIGGAGSTQFYNITTTNTTSVNVTGTVSMENLLSVNAGSFGTAGAGTFTLLANGSVTYANIGPLGATSTLTGTGWINQSYINGPATGYWQFLGTSINGNILNDWDSDTRFYMSGVGGNDGNACCPTFRSVRTYNTAGGNWVNVTTIATALVSGQGFMVWMSDNNQNLTAPLIYDDRGTPNFGDITYAVTAGGGGGGFNLV
ncbi:MAG TPA: hypothetical protein VI731_06025, partial [Bacteroidia bacterium]|nr:hypothetical protein [Bacteroidia bacterium]